VYVANCSDRTKHTVLPIIFNLCSPLDLEQFGGILARYYYWLYSWFISFGSPSSDWL